MSKELTYETYQARRHILALDGLRAVAIFGVLLHHTRNKPFYFLHGFRGVWIFFVISGYLITTLALREEERAGKLDIKAFAIRRAFRILPLYYLTLLWYCVWVFVLHMEPNAARFQDHLLNFFFYTPEFPIFHFNFAIPFGQTWSLGIEEKFYLVWPLLAFWLLAKSKYRIWVTTGLIVVSLALMQSSATLAQMWGSYCDILLGCLLAQLLQRRSSYDTVAKLGRPLFAWGSLGLLALATVWNGTGTQLGERGYSLVAAVAVAAIVTNRHGPATYASYSWLRAMGTWSYAIYLTHALVIDVVNPFLPAGRIADCLSLIATLSIVLPLCWLLHVAFEKPLIKLGRRFAAQSDAKLRAQDSYAPIDR